MHDLCQVQLLFAQSIGQSYLVMLEAVADFAEYSAKVQFQLGIAALP